MALMLNLEIESCVTLHAVREALMQASAVLTEEDQSPLMAFWERSGVSVFVRTNLDYTQVLAEGLDTEAAWQVGVRLVFSYSIADYDAGNQDVKIFLEALCHHTHAFFVLSFQGEEVYAVRDENGLRYYSVFAQSLL
ncbi:hypothetical protein [Paracidovorax oryzae]|uniref:hypothetical protein n=1 Tax=Paracidovorax oryzae TaxID=862720 RepID=UPI0012EBD8C7|nr:hypothetical protein [Paracidovorax oryzae]